MIDAEKMRERFADTNRGKTHYEGCEYVHPLCAIEALHREVERLRDELNTLDGYWRKGSSKQMNAAFERVRHGKPADETTAKDEPDWLPAPDTMPDGGSAMNSEAKKNPVLNIRQELEELRRAMALRDKRSVDGDASFAADELEDILSRIPEGCDLRPREPSAGMIEASWREAAVASPNAWRAMWDAASEEKGDGLSD